MVFILGCMFFIWLYRNAYYLLPSWLRYFTSGLVIYQSLVLTSLANFVSDDFMLSLEPLLSTHYGVELIAIGPRNILFDDDFLFSYFANVS